MKKIAFILIVVSLISIFVLDIIFYQQEACRIFVVILAIIGIISGLIIDYKNHDDDNYDEDELR